MDYSNGIIEWVRKIGDGRSGNVEIWDYGAIFTGNDEDSDITIVSN